MSRLQSTQASDGRWGDQAVEVCLAAGRFRFAGLSAAQAEDLSRRYGRLAHRRAEGKPDVLCTGRRLPVPIDLPAECFGKDGQYAPLMRHEPGALVITGVNFSAAVQWGRRARASLSVAHEEELASSAVVENLLRVLCGYLALDRGGLLLHSAGLLLGGAAYLFVGRSGAGKTTLARKALALDVPVLGDDINLLLPGARGLCAYPVPFAGELGETPSVLDGKGYPLGAVILLLQGAELALRRVPPADSVARILAASPFVNADPTRIGELLERITGLVGETPVFELVTARADGFDAIRDRLEAAVHAG